MCVNALSWPESAWRLCARYAWVPHWLPGDGLSGDRVVFQPCRLRDSPHSACVLSTCRVAAAGGGAELAALGREVALKRWEGGGPRGVREAGLWEMARGSGRGRLQVERSEQRKALPSKAPGMEDESCLHSRALCVAFCFALTRGPC